MQWKHTTSPSAKKFKVVKMNDTIYLEAARKLAERMLREGRAHVRPSRCALLGMADYVLEKSVPFNSVAAQKFTSCSHSL